MFMLRKTSQRKKYHVKQNVHMLDLTHQPAAEMQTNACVCLRNKFIILLN